MDGLVVMMMEIRNKIFAFRDILDLPPFDASASINQIVLGLIKDLKKLYPDSTYFTEKSEISEVPIQESLVYLCKTLKSIGDSWVGNDHQLMEKLYFQENINSEKLAEIVAPLLDTMIMIARGKFNIADEDDQVKDYNNSRTNSFEKIESDSFLESNSYCCTSPRTPKSVLPDFPHTSPLLLSLRVQAVRKLNPISDVNHLGLHFSSIGSFDSSVLKTEPETEETKINGKKQHQERDSQVELPPEENLATLPNPVPATSPPPLRPPPPPKIPGAVTKAPPPPPPMPNRNGGAPPPPPMPNRNGGAPPPLLPLLPMVNGNGGAMPPPPPPPGGGAARSLRRKKANTKLKRSTQLGNLYRTLKGKLEGTNLDGKSSSNGKRGCLGNGSNAGGKKGMAEALAEMTKRSAYFQQIEEDVQKYSKPIMEMKTMISSFQAKDMDKLLKFHKDVESVLEQLTDESQVLSRFEGFPTKKLEALRSAVALYKKLHNILNELRNWKFDDPIGQLLDKVERYFNKIKVQVDAVERTKDEESKIFQSHSIDFDFNIIVWIKESMVDVSSSCMENVIKDKREAKAIESSKSSKTERNKKGSDMMLWRAFQLAFRVYTFAGGHDDRADKLTKELADELV